MNATHRSARGRERGFVVVAVLLVIAALAMVGTTYIKHVETVRRDRSLSANALDGRTAADSAAEVARKALALGETVDDAVIEAGRSTAGVAASALGDGRSRTLVRAVEDDGIGATLLAETAWVPSGEASEADDLPRLQAELLADVLADASISKHYYSGQSRVANTELEGLVVVRNGSALVLDDVVIRGCIVSEDTLFDALLGEVDLGTVPTVVVAGNLRIDPIEALPGLALCLPDGVFMTYGGEGRVQIDGDVVAYTVQLLAPGAIRGNIASVDPPELHADFELVGSGRHPLPWSPALDTSNSPQAVDFMAFLPRTPDLASLSAISTAALPAPGSGSSGGGKLTDDAPEGGTGSGSSSDGSGSSGSGGSGSDSSGSDSSGSGNSGTGGQS